MPERFGFKYNDGGRKKFGFDGFDRDCVVRAIAIATNRAYPRVYEMLNYYCEGGYHQNPRMNYKERVYWAHSGIPVWIYLSYLKMHGWRYVKVDMRKRLKLAPENLPKRDIVLVTMFSTGLDRGHLVAVRKGVLEDTFRYDDHVPDAVIRGYFIRKRRKRRAR